MRCIKNDCVDCLSFLIIQIGERFAKSGLKKNQYPNFKGVTVSMVELVGFINVLKTEPVTEPEKLPVHGSLVGPVVEPWLNR